MYYISILTPDTTIEQIYYKTQSTKYCQQNSKNTHHINHVYEIPQTQRIMQLNNT